MLITASSVLGLPPGPPRGRRVTHARSPAADLGQRRQHDPSRTSVTPTRGRADPGRRPELARYRTTKSARRRQLNARCCKLRCIGPGSGAGGVRVILGDEADRPQQEASIRPEQSRPRVCRVFALGERQPASRSGDRPDAAAPTASTIWRASSLADRAAYAGEDWLQIAAVASRRAATAGYRYGARPSDGAAPLVDGRRGTDHPSRAQAANDKVSVPG